MLFILPVILFYWFLTLINFDPLKPLIAMLGSFLDPFIESVRTVISYEMMYNGIKVDFTPLISGGVVLLVYYAFSLIDNMFSAVDDSVKNVKEKLRQSEVKKHQDQVRKNYLETLAQNKIIYLVVKLKTNQTSAAYLCDKENDIFSEGITNTLMNNILESASKYESKRYKDFKGTDNTYNFIFYNITDAIDYSFYVYNKVAEANKNVIDPSIRISFAIACNCSYSEDTAVRDFAITRKILNLAGDSEIMASELFKDKYKALKDETNLLFVSKGIYNIDDNQLETFQLKVSKPRN